MPSAFSIAVEMPGGLSYPDFDKRVMKRELKAVRKPLRKRAQELVSKRGISRPGEYPGRRTGALRKAVWTRTSKSGFSIALYESADRIKKGAFYPAFVYYGHRGPHTSTAMDARQHKRRAGRKAAAPRGNWIVGASEEYARREWPAASERILVKAVKRAFAK